MNIISRIEYFIGDSLTRLGFKMKAKLITIFVIIMVIPLILLALIAWHQAMVLGRDMNRRAQEMNAQANDALLTAGDIAVTDSEKALNALAVEQIERTSTDLANRVAEFLYGRDKDILYLASLEPSEAAYRRFLEHSVRAVIVEREWKLSDDKTRWVPAEPLPKGDYSASTNGENNTGYQNRPPDQFKTEMRPTYLEATFVDTAGNEIVKVSMPDRSGAYRLDTRKRNVSSRLNTYVKAETYFGELKNLKQGDIYVSDVIGPYVPSHVIGMYNPETVAARGLQWQPEKEAYAGQENPVGVRFRGIVRWASPVYRGGLLAGYVTLALDHDHIMEFTDHTTPMSGRYVEMPSAFEGNYAFIWDYQCRSISHPRHHSIVGYDPETGLEQTPWLEESIYQGWQSSGLELWDYLKDYPEFYEQSREKRPAAELTRAGLVGLDGRYLNNAPQCRGWMDLTAEGGSGSFLILWSGIWKPNTAAAIRYYTGKYGRSKRGFGFVSVGAGLEDFQRPARLTEDELNDVIAGADAALAETTAATSRAIRSNMVNTTAKLLGIAALMIALVVLVAIWMASAFTASINRLNDGIDRFRSGDRRFRFKSPIKDELGLLADSFDQMADSLVEADRGPLVITDMGGYIKYANDAALESFGCSLEECLGKPYQIYSVYPPGSEYDPVAALFMGKKPKSFLVKTGVEEGRWYQGSASYLTDQNGRRLGFIIISQDITNVVNEQRQMAEQKLLLDTIFNDSPDMIWYQNVDSIILAANPRFAQLSDFEPEELIGKNVEEIVPQDVVGNHKEFDAEVYHGHRPVYSEEVFRFADGHVETMDLVITPVYDDNGRPLGILGFGRDVSSRVRVEQELRHTQENLEQAVEDANRANAHKGEFLARMSHEIRTPMNAIIGMTNIVRKKLADGSADMEEIQANIDQIEVSSQHLLGLLNDILDISKIEAGKIELVDEVMDLEKLVNTVQVIIKPRCDEKNINFVCDFRLPEDIWYRGDTLRLRQVLINLLGNAVKFTPEMGEIDFTVRHRESREGEDGVRISLVDFSVKDSGIGISEEALAGLFKPFEQASSQISRKYGGTGLGLAISRSIVQMFGGDITVQSRPDEGSDFSFSLWLPETGAEAVVEINAEDAAGLLVGKRALLVDDVDINRIIAANMLEFTGIEIEEAADGVEAVKAFGESAEGYFDIIYMDVQMPNMDGHEAAVAIRALDREDAKTVPIVALTANAFKDDIDKAIASGMNAHLAKPLDMEKLIEVTLSLLGLIRSGG